MAVGKEEGRELRALEMSGDQKTCLLPNQINLRFYERGPVYILQMKVLAQMRRRYKWGTMCWRKRAALEKAPQIAHYKMIIAHIHVLLCFRK